MSSATTRKSESLGETNSTTRAENRWLSAPWLWGPLLTAGFLQFVPHLLEHRESLTRLFISRGILYAETGLFFFGLAILIRRTLGLIQERRALRLIVIDEASLEGLRRPADRARALYSATADVPAGISRTKLVARIREACDYVAHHASGASVEEHLRYLADLAVESLSSSYAVVRTLIWSAPILGVLGTILGMTLAFQTIDPENLDASIPMAAGELAAAFDPTALALGISLILLFARLLVERSESRVLACVEQFAITQLAPCLHVESSAAAGSVLAEAETGAAAKLLDQTELLINTQTALWQQGLEDLRGRWLETVEKQQTQFAGLLEKGMVAGLASHSQQLDEARAEFLTGFRAVGMELSRVTAGLQQMGEEHQTVFHKQVSEVWQAMQAQMTAQLLEFQRQGQLLHTLTGQEDELLRLQTTLTHNLQSVRALEAFQESVHSLNAAVHLLTMRTKANAA